VLGVLHPRRRGHDVAPSSTGTSRRARSSRAARAPASTCPRSARPRRSSRAAARPPVRSLHARRRRVGRHDQVGRQDPPRGQDGDPQRRPPRHRGVHLDQGREEKKVRVLREAGFDMDLDGEDYASIQYQNANNSVRVTDEFMRPTRPAPPTRCVRSPPARCSRRRTPATSCARSPRPPGSAPTRACSTTPPSTTGTPRPESGRINGSNPCSEYMHLDNSACNLASLNLKKFYDYDAGRFDVEAYKRAVEIVFTAQEIIVGYSSYPTESIGKNAIDFRELGLGYANLGGLLMSHRAALRLRRGSGVVRGAHGADDRARLPDLRGAREGQGPFTPATPRTPADAAGHRQAPRRRRRHRPAAGRRDLLDAARTSWDEALELGRSTATATRRPPCWRRPAPSA
jgi:ribonucleoside-diphosphate reductase alpha chain